MQPTYGPFTDNTFLTEGGNKNLVNGNEAKAIQASYEGIQSRTGTLSAEDDSHVQGIFRESDFAGS
jgi:hypothetical protein